MLDFSTLSHRQQTLAVQVPYRRIEGPLNLLVDSTGIKFLGGGEWHTRRHRPQGRRQYRKVHLAMDPPTSDIRAVEFTTSRDGVSPDLPGLHGQIPEDEHIGTMTADGAYETRRCHRALSSVMLLRSFRSGKTADCGKTIARQHAPETRLCPPPDTTGARSGNAGPDSRLQPRRGEARRRCAA